jgi:hypothetical protein
MSRSTVPSLSLQIVFLGKAFTFLLRHTPLLRDLRRKKFCGIGLRKKSFKLFRKTFVDSEGMCYKTFSIQIWRNHTQHSDNRYNDAQHNNKKVLHSA